LNHAWVLTTFTDLGRVTSLPPTSSDQKTAKQLRGQGLSLGWQGPMGVSTRLTWSRRSGNNPQPTNTGTDGDGTLKFNRLWLTNNVAF
jgi:hypothetical protein